MKERLKIMDVWVDPLSREECLQRIRHFLQAGERCHTVFAVNPEKNFSVPADPVLYDAFREADLLIPDGMGVMAAVRILYGMKIERVPGVELMQDICAMAARQGHKVFVYGAREEVNEASVHILKKRYPGLDISGRSNGYVKEEKMEALIEKINASGAEILFLALGSPRQERWIAAYGDKLDNVKVCQGIGGTLDTIAGHVRRAPVFWRKCLVEWLYRAILEPKRIRRQRFLWIFAGMVFMRRFREMARDARQGQS